METKEMDVYTVVRDLYPDLMFQGVKLAHVSSRWVAGKSQDRWQELTLYRTAKGKYVLQHSNHTLWQGEEEEFSGTVFASANAVLEEMLQGRDWLHPLDKELLREAALTDQAFLSLWIVDPDDAD